MTYAACKYFDEIARPATSYGMCAVNPSRSSELQAVMTSPAPASLGEARSLHPLWEQTRRSF